MFALVLVIPIAILDGIGRSMYIKSHGVTGTTAILFCIEGILLVLFVLYCMTTMYAPIIMISENMGIWKSFSHSIRILFRAPGQLIVVDPIVKTVFLKS